MLDAQTLFPFIAAVSLAVATLVSEDVTCVAAGVLVAEGRLSFPSAVAGCLAGIVAGDVALMLAGRYGGERVIDSSWIRRLITAETVAAAARWMQARGAFVIFLSRFLPGTRFATYVAAGALGVDVRWFTAYAAASAMVWVPALIGVSAVAGRQSAESGLMATAAAAGRAVAAAVILIAVLRALAASHHRIWRVQRRLLGFWRRRTRWEFWPVWMFYPPVLAYIAWLAVRYRSLTLFTAANPGIPAGGVVGESKFAILRGLRANHDRVARAALIPGGAPAWERTSLALAFMDRAGLSFPVILKPDQGQRGAGVVVVHSHNRLRAHFEAAPGDRLVQEYVAGVEFGVFYYRRPSETRGHVFSITAKQFPAVTGDGRSTLETLILADDRAVCLERVHRRRHAARLADVPSAGERVTLVELGSHCRGSLFVDGAHLATPALVEAIDETAQRFAGFHFGRFDVRAPSVDAFRAGQFRVLELNGVTSEATHIYDPQTPIVAAYRVLFRQWQIAFQIGEENQRRGVRPATLAEIVSMALRYRRVARMHPVQVQS